LVLLAGRLMFAEEFLPTAPWMPVLAVAAHDDGDAVTAMRRVVSFSTSPESRLKEYARGGHGTDLFRVGEDLEPMIADWFVHHLATDLLIGRELRLARQRARSERVIELGDQRKLPLAPPPAPSNAPKRPTSATQATTKAKPRRLTFKETAELAELPDRIDALERERAALHESLADPAVLRDGSAVVAARSRLHTVETEITELTERWGSLETIAAQA
jgi:hypothetical protein